MAFGDPASMHTRLMRRRHAWASGARSSAASLNCASAHSSSSLNGVSDAHAEISCDVVTYSRCSKRSAAKYKDAASVGGCRKAPDGCSGYKKNRVFTAASHSFDRASCSSVVSGQPCTVGRFSWTLGTNTNCWRNEFSSTTACGMPCSCFSSAALRASLTDSPACSMLYNRTTPSLSSLGTNSALMRGSSTADTAQCSPGTAALRLQINTWDALSRRATQSPRRCSTEPPLADTRFSSTMSWSESSGPSPWDENAYDAMRRSVDSGRLRTTACQAADASASTSAASTATSSPSSPSYTPSAPAAAPPYCSS